MGNFGFKFSWGSAAIGAIIMGIAVFGAMVVETIIKNDTKKT